MTGAAREDIINGCSGGVSRFYLALTGRDIACRYCCDEHDLAYLEGGGRDARALADYRFWECVRDSGSPGLALLFWAAVRLFGWAYWSR